SAMTGEGLNDLLLAIGDRMRALTTVIELLIPYDRGDIVATVHREGEVVSTANEESGMRVRARLADASAGRLSQFVVNK
ncbi:MAG: GTPase HflX, partial [Acidimicrobiaceae bacterium]